MLSGCACRKWPARRRSGTARQAHTALDVKKVEVVNVCVLLIHFLCDETGPPSLSMRHCYYRFRSTLPCSPAVLLILPLFFSFPRRFSTSEVDGGTPRPKLAQASQPSS